MNKGINKIFSEVAQTYEVVNHVLTFGLDNIWRRKAAKEAVMGSSERWMDICTGTGEMAACLRDLSQKKTMVVAVDGCLPMIQTAIDKPGAECIHFVLADVSDLPFQDKMFDLVTISFATRNINLSRDILITYFRELYRILKPGGRFINLETSQPPSKIVRTLLHTYIRLTVRPLGYLISKSSSGYTYLAHTIPRFYQADELADIIRHAGFADVTFTRMMFGIVAIHKAVK